ncbi:neuronal tyrosine-phosphorylated phosphoinositide-3-kinase adapter 2 isoform X2 [Denticeps clupeoides]|uniref:Neuronal tyrosine-phosphorylated phosphoinositide-3-kinase adapter 2-like n=1 Tax=Denticeps clupeoides TaxID=299321 RepID=A0AAY4AFT7_9TELE|nr:neuronal tyrosine-phosphorylated phosphoinositide-3-kinase adapter 2-like isoform X2 [Denticeps clupeoides]
MSTKEEETLRFFQYVEHSGLRAYNGLISQKHNHVRNEKKRAHFQEKNDKKRKQEEVTKRTEDDIVTEGKHLRMVSMTMPAPPERVAPSCGPGFAVRSQSLHSVGGGEEDGSPTSRRQPPPKPRRDPNTKLSISSETVDLASITCRNGNLERCDASQGCSEDCRRVPPPKPKRNPNTQLSTSFDESYIRTHGSKGSPPGSQDSLDSSPPQPGAEFCRAQSQSPCGQDINSEEPVYIEMSGNVAREQMRSEDEEPGEAVYEEMKYPAGEEMDSRCWELSGYRSQCPTPCPSLDPEPLSRCTTPRGTPLCDIPAPFPNLLTHRPPLLVFPPTPAQCSPNSDESPLTPMDVTKLPMLENGSYSKSPTSSSSMEAPGSSSSSSSSHMRRAERELTATPTITVSGRSSAPPLPCTLYKTSNHASGHGYQRSHSACPSPVSMGRCLTPLSLMRAPPFDGPFTGTGLPRSASATPHGKGSPPHDNTVGGRLHGSMQNVSMGRSRTPTSPLDELTNLFTTGRNMLKKNSSGRKSKEPGESESKGRCHTSESKREGKERGHHSKESKREAKERSHSSKEQRRDSKDRGCSNPEPIPRRDSKDRGSSNPEPIPRRDSKDRGSSNPEPIPRRDSKDRVCSNPEPIPRRDSKDRVCSNPEPLPRRDSKDRVCSNPEPIPRRDSKDRGSSNPEPIPRRDSKDRGSSNPEPLARRDSKDRVCSNPEPLPRRDSKDRVCSNPEPLPRRDSKDRPASNVEPLPRRDSKDRGTNINELRPRRDSKDRGCNGADVLTRQDSKEMVRNGTDPRRDGKERGSLEVLSRHSNKDPTKNGLEKLRDSKDGGWGDFDSRRDCKDRSVLSTDCRRGSKDRNSNTTDLFPRRDFKERSGHGTDALTRLEGKDRDNHSIEGSKANEWDAIPVQPSVATPSHIGRSSASPTTNSDMKTVPRSPSMPVPPSPNGTPQKQHQEPLQSQMLPMPWVCGDSTMMEMIERKQRLCREIRSRQRPANRSPCKQESLPIVPTWKKSNGAKTYGPPPYPSQTTIFWDTAI